NIKVSSHGSEAGYSAQFARTQDLEVDEAPRQW
ncbi:hypothetical protein A2U01_0042005, partial [Trifolium medium]|nr:hypothetical protein [Trifolium medium]